MEKVYRSLPNFKGKGRLARLIFRKKMKEGKDLLIDGSHDCRYKLPNLSEYLAFEIFINGMYEPETHSLLVKSVPLNGVFLDLGANIGSIAIPLCKTRKDIVCIAVEASPWIFEYLRYNVGVNQLDQQMRCVNKAIADTEIGQLPFYSPVEEFGKGSLSPVFTQQGSMVDTISIDKLLRDFNLGEVSTIKIDIEGFEYFAFKGGSSLLSADNAPDIIFEFVDWAEDLAGKEKGSAQRLLKEFGYKLYAINNKSLTYCNGIMNSGNQLFFATKKDKHN